MYSIIVAYDDKYGIGKNGTIPWKPPANDMKRFREITLSGSATVLMGRRTYESLPKPLAGRRNIVLSSRKISGVEVYHGIDEAFNKIALVNGCVIGGSALYEYAINDSRCKKLYVTKIDGNYDCDVFMPEIPLCFEIIGEQSGPKCKFLIYERSL